MAIIPYVVGFLFDENRDYVVLIEKNKPDWQKGYLNGVGGKIENNETPIECMIREFKEEAGITVNDWSIFMEAEHRFDNKEEIAKLYFLKAFIPNLDSVEGQELERVHIVSLQEVRNYTLLSNIKWLIDIALDDRFVGGTFKYHN